MRAQGRGGGGSHGCPYAPQSPLSTARRGSRGGGGGGGSAAPSPLPARGGGGGWGVLHPIESACGEGGACGGACVAQSPSMEVAARIALATIGERGDDGGALGPLLGREGGGGGGEEGEGACALSARKQRRTSPHDAAWRAGGGGGGAARLSSSFQQVKPLGAAATWRPPLAGGGGRRGVSATIVEVGATSAGSELTCQLVCGEPRGSPDRGSRLRLCVSPLAGRGRDAAGRLPVRAGVMETGFSGGGGGGRGRVPGSTAERDPDVYCSPLLGGGEGADDEEFADGCAHAERAVGRVDDVFAIV